MKNNITQKMVRELFRYEDGNLYWRKRRGSAGAGKIAGYLQNNGYLSVMINKKNYLQHHIVWLYHYGKLPTMLDHINHNRTDNRIENLRLATHKINSKNKSMHSKNTSGHTGVYWDKRNKKWKAQICSDGKTYSLGRFNELENAVLARAEAESKYNFHFNHGFNSLRQ